MFETQNLIDAVETVTFRWIGVNLLNKFAVCFENDIEIPLATLTNIILHVQENMVYSREVCKYLNILLFITDKFKNEKSWKFGFDFVHQLIRLDEDQITVTKILVNISGLPCRVDAFENVELIELALKKTIKLLEKVESKIDLVLLKLGFLINLVEHSSQIRQIISQLELENQFLDKLSAVFLKLQEQEEKIELRIVAAYLGLFLGCLSTENTTNLDMVISKISPKILIGILEEFGVLNHMVGNCNPEFVKTFIRIIEMLNGQIK